MIKSSAHKRLEDFGIHPSRQRVAIMDYLMEHRIHPTAEDVYQGLIDSIPTLSRTTVYNTLRMFSDAGAALMLTIDEKKFCFDGCTKPHAHLWCRKCGRVVDLEWPRGLRLKPFKTQNCSIEETHVYYRGLCDECLQNNEKEA